MTVELFCLLLFGILIIIAILIQQLTSMMSEGIMPILGSREGLKFSGITGRLERAILNSVIASVIIAPAIISIQILEISSKETIIASQIFLITRALYILAYAFKVVLLRSGCWITGLLSILYLYFSIL